MPRRKRSNSNNSNSNSSNSTSFYGLAIKAGDCLKVIFGRYCYYIEVLEVNSENPTVVLGRDLYGKQLVLRLTKALMVQKIPREEYESKKKW